MDCIKLDKTFVEDILVSKIDAAIAKAAVDLARTIGIDIIAEGVDSRDKLELITSLGCHLIQGFLFSKPLSSESFAEYCKKYPSTGSR